MHIIGGHDYYDCMLAYGRDMDIVFVRDGRKVSSVIPKEDDGFNFLRSSKREVHIRYNDQVVKQPWNREWLDVAGVCWIRYRTVRVIIADTVYRGLKLSISYDKNPPLYSNFPDYYVWSEDQLNRLLPGLAVFERKGLFSSSKEERIRWFTAAKLDAEQIKLMIDHQIAVVIDDGTVDDLVINGDGLKGVGFYKLLTPLECYTALYDWISGVLSTNANKMVQIQDPKILLKKHGMDETSFRNPKRKKA